jgi:hypothetical protein
MQRLIIILLVLTSACTHTQISTTTGAAPAATGTAVSSSAAGLQVQGGGPLAAVLFAGFLAAVATQDLREPRPFRPFYDWMGTRTAPEMKPDRAVSEQDCTKPIEFTENLRCR